MDIIPKPQPDPNHEIDDQTALEQTDLELLLDRHFVKYARYADARFELLAAQMRINEQESLARDRTLADALITLGQHVGTIEANQGTIIAMQHSMLDMMGSMQATLGDIQQEMRAGFAGLGGQLDELTDHVKRLERKDETPDPEA